MSERSASLLLNDILSAVQNILVFSEGLTLENYILDLKTKHAVERNFEVMGEAVARLPETFKAQHHQVDWRIMKDFRNFIIHEYFGIDDEIIWETIQKKLPGLLTRLKEI